MTRKANILVVANRTALSAGLESALRARLKSGPATFTLVVPLGRRPDAAEQVQHIGKHLRAAGLEVDVRAGDGDPLRAVLEAWSPAEFDEIIVSTLPAWKSRWMKTGLPQRIERHTGALVRHFEAREVAAPPFGRETDDAGSDLAKAR